MNFKEEASLNRINIKTKKIELLKIGDFEEPTFSYDGKFILFHRDLRRDKSIAWIRKIYLLEMATLKEQKISNAYFAQWAK